MNAIWPANQEYTRAIGSIYELMFCVLTRFVFMLCCKILHRFSMMHFTSYFEQRKGSFDWYIRKIHCYWKKQLNLFALGQNATSDFVYVSHSKTASTVNHLPHFYSFLHFTYACIPHRPFEPVGQTPTETSQPMAATLLINWAMRRSVAMEFPFVPGIRIWRAFAAQLVVLSTTTFRLWFVVLRSPCVPQTSDVRFVAAQLARSEVFHCVWGERKAASVYLYRAELAQQIEHFRIAIGNIL